MLAVETREPIMKISSVYFVLLAAASLSAQAYPGDETYYGEHGARVGAMRAELFAEFKGIESWSHMERIRILQEAEACIQAATNRDQYRACEDREAQAREQVKAQVKYRHELLRAKVDGLRQGMALRP
jgi:hypothetical protein